MIFPNHAPDTVRCRIVLHFAGFEPLDAEAHRQRYARAAEQSAHVWQNAVAVGQLDHEAQSFHVEASGPDWRTLSTVHVFDLAAVVEDYRRRPLALRIAAGFTAAARVIADGAAVEYFRHAWRFGLFFLSPFLLMAAGIAAAIVLACLPFLLGMPLINELWSVPLGLAFFLGAFIPFSDRFHTLHLFADWRMAVALARLGDAELDRLLRSFEAEVLDALREEADEILITSHSIGTNLAVHVIGRLLETKPDLFAGRNVAFVTLGGALLQCALMKSAKVLREHVGRIARVENLAWLDVQCLTDIVNFYRSRSFELCGHRDLEPAAIRLIRFKRMLDPEHYRRIKRDMLRVHRQYVLGLDRRADFDFTLLTAGPFPANAFASFDAERLPPLTATGALHRPVAVPA
jgi:hypothetical protein